MATKTLAFTKEKLEEIINTHPTPFHIYDEKGIKENALNFKKAFSWNPGFKEYFAVKAAPNPFLMKILKALDFGADCSSFPELVLAEKTGITGTNIMFTSNDTPAYEYQKAMKLGAIINLDDISHIPYLETHAGLPDIISCRYNPGHMKTGNFIIGEPTEAKYGFTREQMFEGYKILKEKGITRFGIHTMVASNELNPEYFVETADLIFSLMVDLHKELGIRFEFANLGGGIGIPYKPEDTPVDVRHIGKHIEKLYHEKLDETGLLPVKLFFELGRYITGPYGYLVSKVLHLKKTYKNYAGLDASMANLMRPALYGAYHHITVVGKEDQPHTMMYDVTGSLCENNDKFAINRMLPVLAPNDLIVIHDAGAHGHSMGFNYNSKLRSAELLLRPSGEVIEIRREESMEDHFATLNFNQLKSFEV